MIRAFIRPLTLFFFFAVLTPATAFSTEKLTLMLDWFPNVDHAPIYVAQEKGYFADNGLAVTIITPSETSDALKLAASGQVDLAVSYQPQTTIAAARGLDLKVVAPLVRHPLTTLLFLDEAIKAPADLSGKKIGYTVPGLMDVLLKAFADINGISDYTPVNVGFTILPALSAQKVAAVMGPFKTYETVGMAQHGVTAHYFELEKYGIPDYEELVFVSGPKALAEKTGAVKGFTTAIARAFKDIQTDPDQALALYLNAVPEADKTLETKAFKLTRPFFAKALGHDVQKWQAFADFALKYGLIDTPVKGASLIYTW